MFLHLDRFQYKHDYTNLRVVTNRNKKHLNGTSNRVSNFQMPRHAAKSTLNKRPLASRPLASRPPAPPAQNQPSPETVVYSQRQRARKTLPTAVETNDEPMDIPDEEDMAQEDDEIEMPEYTDQIIKVCRCVKQFDYHCDDYISCCSVLCAAKRLTICRSLCNIAWRTSMKISRSEQRLKMTLNCSTRSTRYVIAFHLGSVTIVDVDRLRNLRWKVRRPSENASSFRAAPSPLPHMPVASWYVLELQRKTKYNRCNVCSGREKTSREERQR